MTAAQLRGYQVGAIAEVDARWANGQKRVLCAMPTGAGKTELGIHLMQRELVAGGRALVIVDRKVLCAQWIDKMRDRGIDWVGILQGENTIGTSAPALVGTAQTIRSRGVPEGVSFIIIDESHIWHQTHDVVLKKTNGAKVLGLTATPLRPGLGLRFESMVVGATIRNLIAGGYLVGARYFAPSSQEIANALSKVSITAGDFNAKELGKAMRGKQIIGDVVGTWQRLGENRQTIAFCVDKQHARDLAAEFLIESIEARVVLDDTPDEERVEIFSGFKEGAIRVLVSVGVLSIGFDAPNAACAILARPTLSLSLHIQQGGRVLRPFPGKADALILDHACNTRRHGFLEDFVPPADLSMIDENADRKRRDDSAQAWECHNCNALNPIALDICDECGHPRRPYSTVVILDGKLTRFEYEEKDAVLPGPTPEEVRIFYQMALFHARERGMKSGWAYHATLRRFDIMSSTFKALKIFETEGLPPDQAAARWFKSDRQRSFFSWRYREQGVPA